jgi:hypothetical protein
MKKQEIQGKKDDFGMLKLYYNPTAQISNIEIKFHASS